MLKWKQKVVQDGDDLGQVSTIINFFTDGMGGKAESLPKIVLPVLLEGRITNALPSSFV
jgi:hypothetical protein